MLWLRALWTQIWVTLVVAAVALALYTSLGRQLIPLVETYRADLEQQLSAALGQPVYIGQLKGGWNRLSPNVEIRDIQFGPAGDGISVRSVQAELDVSASLFYRLPVFQHIIINGVASEVHHLGGTDWRIGSQWPLNLAAHKPAEQPAQPDKSRSSAGRDEQPLWLRWLELQKSIELTDWQLVAFDPDQTREVLNVERLALRSQGPNHEFDSHIEWGREQVASIRAMASMQGDLWPWNKQHGEVYLDVQSQEWSRFIPDNLPSGLKVNNFSAGAEAWLTVSDGDLSSLYLNADIPQLTIATQGEPIVLSNGILQVAGKHNGEDWHLQVRPHFDQTLPFNDFSLSSIALKASTGLIYKGWQVGIPQADIAEATDFLSRHSLLPAPFDRYISNINARGQASAVHLSAIPGTPWKMDVKANLHEVSTDAYSGIPAFEDISGKVQLQPHGGRLDVDSEDFRMLLSGIYDNAWDLKQAHGSFFWSVEPDYARLQVDGLSGYLSGTEDDPGIWPVAVELGLTLPRIGSNKESAINLMVGMPQAEASLRHQLVPALLNDGIRSWIDDSVTDGHFTDAAFVMRRPLHDGHIANTDSAQLYLNFSDARVKYLADWPAAEGLSGRLLLRAPELDVHIDQGRTLGGTLVNRSGRVTITPGRDGHSLLDVRAHLQGDAGEAIQYFTETPLQSLVNNQLDSWQADGPVDAALQLQMPLGEEAALPDIRLQADIKDTQLKLPDLNLAFSDINGRLNYTSADGLNADALNGKTFGGVFNGRIASLKRGDGFDIQLHADGDAGIAEVREWLPTVLLDPVSGRMNYSADLAIGGDNLTFLLNMPLKDTVIDLPYPYGKAADEERQLAVEVQPGRETRINLVYDDRVRAALALDDEGLNRGQVYLGDTEPFLPSDKGLEIRGSISETLQADVWWETWQHMMALLDAEEKQQAAQRRQTLNGATASTGTAKHAAAQSGPVRMINIALDDVNLWGTPSGPATVIANQRWNEWTFDFNSELIKGKATLYPDNSPIDLNLDYIHFPPQAEEPQSLAELDDEQRAAEGGTSSQADFSPEDPLQDMMPADIPAFNMVLTELYIGTRNFGRWQLEARSQDKGTVFHVIDSDTKGLKVKGDVYWDHTADGHKTRLDVLNLTSKDLGAIQRAFRQEAVIEGNDMNASLQMSWDGSPMAFNTPTLNGLASLRIRNGSMAAEGTGALKAFGALNFNAISRRLMLDFSDIYQEGVAFDVFRGKAKIENGLLTLTEPLSMDGTGGTFLTSGSTNLVDETLDMKMVVTFPVSSTLPIVALLAGLAPPVAASIYVTEKLIGDELARFTSARYNLTGTWQQPDLKIDKAFNNTIDGKKEKRGIWRRVMSVLDVFNLMEDDDE